MSAKDGSLLAHGPRGAVTPALAAAIRERKAATLASLSLPPGPCPGCKAAMVWRLRCGVVVCPGCCPVPSGTVIEKLVWRDDLAQWREYEAELAQAVQERRRAEKRPPRTSVDERGQRSEAS